jgi:cytochrome o ubiquinol oxidase subunit 2
VRPSLAYRSQRLALAFGVASLCGGCGFSHGPVIDPKGPITFAERGLMFDAIMIMLIVIVPVFILAALFVWRYRASNSSARYTPNIAYYWPVEVLVWHDTYKLDPYASIDPGVQPLQVDVVAQDWKWLFIYPEQDIAVVNELAFPSGRPLSLKITSDTVMNSFVIPALGGQIYAMAGMQTRLHLLADKPGKFWGRNVQYSGSGFADQQFDAVAMSNEDFDAWVAKAKQSSLQLDDASYGRLSKPSADVPVTYYSGVEPDLFDKVVAKYAHGTAHAGGAAAKAAE